MGELRASNSPEHSENYNPFNVLEDEIDYNIDTEDEVDMRIILERERRRKSSKGQKARKEVQTPDIVDIKSSNASNSFLDGLIQRK